MYTRDYRDLIGGGLLLLFGLFIGFHALSDYDLGTLRHMGPGMFPTWLGFLLASIGAVIMVLGLFRPGGRIEPDYRQFVAIIIGVLIFGVTVGTFGMIPAVVLVTIAGVLADDKLGIVGGAVLAVILSVLALLIFRIGLQVPLQAFSWPF